MFEIWFKPDPTLPYGHRIIVNTLAEAETQAAVEVALGSRIIDEIREVTDHQEVPDVRTDSLGNIQLEVEAKDFKRNGKRVRTEHQVRALIDGNNN